MFSVHQVGAFHAQAGAGSLRRQNASVRLCAFATCKPDPVATLKTSNRTGIAVASLACCLNGCAVVAVADAAATVVATTVKVGADVVGAAADATAAGVKAIVKSDDTKK